MFKLAYTSTYMLASISMQNIRGSDGQYYKLCNKNYKTC